MMMFTSLFYDVIASGASRREVISSDIRFIVS